MDAAPFVPFLAFSALLFLPAIGFALYQRQAERRRAQTVEQFAAQRGWAYHAQPGHNLAYALSGREAGVSWELTADKVKVVASRGEKAPETVWHSADGRLADPEDMIMVGIRPPGMKGNLPLDDWLAGPLLLPTLRLVFDADLRGVAQQSAGSTLFQEKCLVLGRRPESARQLVTPALEGPFLDWPADRRRPLGPLLAVDRHGVVVRLRGGQNPSDEPAATERLIAMGLAAVRALRR